MKKLKQEHTSEGINSNFFSFFQRLINVLLLNTLYAQISERSGHIIVVNFKCAHSFAANILSHQFVWMSTEKSIEKLALRLWIISFHLNLPIWFFSSNTWYDNNSPSSIVYNLNTWICFIIRCRICTWYRSSRSAFAFVTKAQGFWCWLFCYFNICSWVWTWRSTWTMIASGCHCCRFIRLSIGWLLWIHYGRCWSTIKNIPSQGICLSDCVNCSDEIDIFDFRKKEILCNEQSEEKDVV